MPESPFIDALRFAFPGARPAAEYLLAVKALTDDLGFTRDRTLSVVSICRDELTTAFLADIERMWGPAFTLAGLGGLPGLGRTGWDAALSHVPDDGGRGALLALGFPHIGIEDDGSIGVTQRHGQNIPTATCGALTAVLGQSGRGEIPTSIDPDDYEASRLAVRLLTDQDQPESLVDLTVRTLGAIQTDLWAAIDAAEVWRTHDVAVFCGIQVHGHGGRDWIWPVEASTTGANGERRPLPFR